MPPPSQDSNQSDGSWIEFRRLVMYRLDRQDENHRKNYSCLTSIKTQLATLTANLNNVGQRQHELVTAQARKTSRSWGAVAGVVASVFVAVLTRLIPFR